MGLFYAQNQKIKYQSHQKEKSDLLPAISGFTIETDKIFKEDILCLLLIPKSVLPSPLNRSRL